MTNKSFTKFLSKICLTVLFKIDNMREIHQSPDMPLMPRNVRRMTLSEPDTSNTVKLEHIKTKLSL